MSVKMKPHMRPLSSICRAKDTPIVITQMETDLSELERVQSSLVFHEKVRQFSVVEPGRELLYEGPIFVTIFDHRAKGKSTGKNLYGFLFNDCFILTKTKHERSKRSSLDFSYRGNRRRSSVISSMSNGSMSSNYSSLPIPNEVISEHSDLDNSNTSLSNTSGECQNGSAIDDKDEKNKSYKSPMFSRGQGGRRQSLAAAFGFNFSSKKTTPSVFRFEDDLHEVEDPPHSTGHILMKPPPPLATKVVPRSSSALAETPILSHKPATKSSTQASTCTLTAPPSLFTDKPRGPVSARSNAPRSMTQPNPSTELLAATSSNLTLPVFRAKSIKNRVRSLSSHSRDELEPQRYGDLRPSATMVGIRKLKYMPGTGLSESMPTTPTSRSRPYSHSAGDMSGSDRDTSFPYDSKPHNGTASEKDAALESPSIGELLRLNSHSKSHAPPPPPSLNFIENTQYNPASSIANGLAAHMSVRPPTTPMGKGGDLDRSAIDAISVESASTPLYIYKVIAEPGEFHTLEFVEGDNHEPICFRWYSSWLQQEYEVDVGMHTTKINHAWRDQFCLAASEEMTVSNSRDHRFSDNPMAKFEAEINLANSKAEFQAQQNKLWKNRPEVADILHTIGAMERNRQECIHEVLVTERSYVAGLKDILILLQCPLRKLNILTEPEAESVFGSVDCLLKMHTPLLAALEERAAETYPLYDNICDILAPFFTQSHVLYSQQCSTIRQRSANAKQLTAENAEFSLFLEELTAVGKMDSLGLQAYAIQPLQRVTKYALLMRDMQRYTDPDHPSYADVECAHMLIKESLDKINDDTKNCEMRLRQCEVTNILSGLDIATPQGQLKMEGTLMISEKNGKEKEVYCFMWDGEIILTKREKIADSVSQPPVDSPKTRRRIMRQSFKVGGANRSDLVKATTAARTASSPEHYYRLASSKIDLRIDASKVYTEEGIIFDFGKGSRCIRVLIPFPGSDHIHMNAKWCTYFESAVKRSKWRQTQDASTIDVHAPSLPQASYGI